MAKNVTPTINTTAIGKEAQQRLHPFHRLRRFGLPTFHLTTFYRGMIESVLFYFLMSWFEGCSAQEKKQLNRVVKTGSKIIGVHLIFLGELYEKCCSSRAMTIIKDVTHPSDKTFSIINSNKRYWRVSCWTSWMLNSFISQAVRF